MSRLSYSPRCPACNEMLDGYGELGPEKNVPRPGDIAVCAYCLTPLEYTENQDMRILDLKTLSRETLRDLSQTIRACRFMREQRRRMN